jgi:hypothetical protein
MTNEQYAKYLKERILEIEKSKEEAKNNPDRKITIVHVEAELFLKMAYLFVGIHGA